MIGAERLAGRADCARVWRGGGGWLWTHEGKDENEAQEVE